MYILFYKTNACIAQIATVATIVRLYRIAKMFAHQPPSTILFTRIPLILINLPVLAHLVIRKSQFVR